MGEYKKIFLYNVKVIDKDKNVINTYSELTSKEIEALKKTLKNNESVKYMPINYKEI